MRSFKICYPLLLLLLICSCSNNEKTGEDEYALNRSSIIDSKVDLIIGAENQPDEHQLGEPVSVRTDKEGNIYIADNASLTVKVFDSEGNYVRSIGRRGRGPAEFMNITVMEKTGDGNFFFLDRGKFQYSIISKEGEHIDSYPVDLSDQVSQYYPFSLAYVGDRTIGLDMSTASPSRSPVPMFERDLFQVYSTDFKKKYYSFGSFSRLGYEDTYAWLQISKNDGSFILSENQETLIYSPGIYNGTFYVYRTQNGHWAYNTTLQGITLPEASYRQFTTEAEYNAAVDGNEPGVSRTYYGEGPHWGKLNSMDAGIFHLSDGRIVHFFGLWREDDEPDSEDHTLDIWAQVFDNEGKLQEHGKVDSLRRSKNPYLTLVNWKDEEDRFYMLNNGEDQIPTVRRFALQFEE